METITMGSSATVRLCRPEDFSAIVDLGDRFKKFLGIYPHQAIMEAIHDGFVFGAFKQKRLAGYALFALPYSDIRLVHLCVDPDFRSQGIARSLVDTIQETYSERQGIRLKCRRDFPAHKVWARLGFQAESLPRGRGKDQAEMTAWRKPFGPPDLFASLLEDETRVQAVLDSNVILDLVLDRQPSTAEFLHSPAIYDEVSFCFTRSVRNELAEYSPSDARAVVFSRLAQFDELPSKLGTCESLNAEILRAIPSDQVDKDPSLRCDSRVLAETIVSGAAVLITNDDNAGSVLRDIANSHGVDVLHPSQLVVKIDELKGRRKDSSDRLQNTGITVANSHAGIDRETDHLISNHCGESKAQFKRHLRSSMATDMKIFHAGGSSLVDGLLATCHVSDEIHVPLLRVRRSPGSPTLLEQLLFQLRLECLKNEAVRIMITDPAPGGGENPFTILKEEGARPVGGHWQIEVVNAQLKLDDFLAGRVGPWDLHDWVRNSPRTPEEFAAIERQLWPLKLEGTSLTNHVVPIRQAYASELLGYDAPLLSRRTDLGVSRRHVYYKSAHSKPAAPGRILWYVSGPKGGSIVAASQLISTHTGVPRDLHARFRKHGVWSQADIESNAKRGRATALRFGNTEIFTSPIPRISADEIARESGPALGTIPTTRRISDVAFQAIYRMGINS